MGRLSGRFFVASRMSSRVGELVVAASAQAAFRTRPDRRTNDGGKLAASPQQFIPPSPAFFRGFRWHERKSSRDAPDLGVFLGLDFLFLGHDVLVDALLDVLLVAVVATSCVSMRELSTRRPSGRFFATSGFRVTFLPLRGGNSNSRSGQIKALPAPCTFSVRRETVMS
jgi:hypothetical protein